MLEKEIKHLIELKQEGSYWDFKREWYSTENKKNGAMLHDIICMANNLANRNAYIIIGVDEENDFKITGVKNDPNRRNTQKMVDFLKDKFFAGGVRPIVYVETINIEEQLVDVIVIENSFQTPFYVEKRYNQVIPGAIYTRIQDTNTPADKGADLDKIEYLWKKRFHLLESPFERVMYYLEDKDNWIFSRSENKKYYQPFPEFTIELINDEDREGYEYYLFCQYDSTPYWYEIRIYYYQTELKWFDAIGLDQGRVITPVPNWLYIRFGFNDVLRLKYYIKDSWELTLQKFYEDSNGDYPCVLEKLLNCVLMFESEDECNRFKTYLEDNWYLVNYDYSDDSISDLEPIEGYNMDFFKKEFQNIYKAQFMLKEFRKEESTIKSAIL